MPLTDNEVRFLGFVKAYFSGADCLPDNAELPAVFAVAARQKLLPIVFGCVSRSREAEPYEGLVSAVRKQVTAQVAGQTVRSAEFSQIYGRLRAEGLCPITVKGRLCSRLYPQKDYRISADDDIFISDGDFPVCHRVLDENGFAASIPANELSGADEVTYTKEGSTLYIELHRRLFDSSDNAPEDFNRFFGDVFGKAVEIDGLFSMPHHEHLLYLILHAYKHFIRGGSGLRQFCDIGLWAREYRDMIDWALLYSQCESVHAASFAAAVFEIVGDLLGTGFVLPPPWKKPKVPVEPLLQDTLSGGIYGTDGFARRHSSTVTLNAVRSARDGRKRGLLSSVFPDKSYMECRYWRIKKYPWLLPWAWVRRIMNCSRENRIKPDDSLYSAVKTAKERIELMKLYGIM